jgi:hypothetical protein
VIPGHFDQFRMHAIGRAVAVLQFALGIDPFIDDSPGDAGPGNQCREQQKAFHWPILA